MTLAELSYPFMTHEPHLCVLCQQAHYCITNAVCDHAKKLKQKSRNLVLRLLDVRVISIREVNVLITQS